MEEANPEWNPALEDIIKKEAETAESFFWLHNKASAWALRRNDGLQIPVIVLSSITGFLSATTNLVPQLALGSISVLVGILGTINSYYKFAQRGQLHATTAQLYMKLYKHLEVELSLPIHQRTDAGVLLKDLREKMTRISELAPEVPQQIINQYKQEFKDSTTSKPIITNGLDPIKVFRTDAQPTTPVRPVVRFEV
jgi:hypothetical protein